MGHDMPVNPDNGDETQYRKDTMADQVRDHILMDVVDTEFNQRVAEHLTIPFQLDLAAFDQARRNLGFTKQLHENLTRAFINLHIWKFKIWVQLGLPSGNLNDPAIPNEIFSTLFDPAEWRDHERDDLNQQFPRQPVRDAAAEWVQGDRLIVQVYPMLRTLLGARQSAIIAHLRCTENDVVTASCRFNSSREYIQRLSHRVRVLRALFFSPTFAFGFFTQRQRTFAGYYGVFPEYDDRSVLPLRDTIQYVTQAMRPGQPRKPDHLLESLVPPEDVESEAIGFPGKPLWDTPPQIFQLSESWGDDPDAWTDDDDDDDLFGPEQMFGRMRPFI